MKFTKTQSEIIEEIDNTNLTPEERRILTQSTPLQLARAAVIAIYELAIDPTFWQDITLAFTDGMKRK